VEEACHPIDVQDSGNPTANGEGLIVPAIPDAECVASPTLDLFPRTDRLSSVDRCGALFEVGGTEPGPARHVSELRARSIGRYPARVPGQPSAGVTRPDIDISCNPVESESQISQRRRVDPAESVCHEVAPGS
jgi:hypothetical protein